MQNRARRAPLRVLLSWLFGVGRAARGELGLVPSATEPWGRWGTLRHLLSPALAQICRSALMRRSSKRPSRSGPPLRFPNAADLVGQFY